MSLFLKERNELLTEKMDQRDCDQRLLFNTYQQFNRINRLLSGWQKIYKREIRPLLNDRSASYSLLDIGCGGGDILNLLHQFTQRDGIEITFTGIEPDPRAIQFLSGREWPENITFKQTTSNKLVDENRSFDIVISNHLVHHLSQKEIKRLCKDAQILANKKVIFNDIERSAIGYAVFKIAATPLFRDSFIVEDGLTSIKRSFKKNELGDVVPPGWQVIRQFPFRLLAIFEPT